MHANVNMCDLWHTRKKAALRPHFPRPCGQLLWLCQTSFLFNLKHGRLRGCALPAPTKVFPSVIKVKDKIGSWEESWSLGRHYGCQEQHLLWCLLQKMSFNPSRVLKRSLGLKEIHMDARKNFSSHIPFRKCHLTHQDSNCPPSLVLDPWRTGMVPHRSLQFNVSNNSSLWNYLKQ